MGGWKLKGCTAGMMGERNEERNNKGEGMKKEKNQ
jgi:hypothetical protein